MLIYQGGSRVEPDDFKQDKENVFTKISLFAVGTCAGWCFVNPHCIDIAGRPEHHKKSHAVMWSTGSERCTRNSC